MNKYILSCALLGWVYTVNAQQFFDGGIKNIVGTTVLVNEAVLNDQKFKPKVSLANATGLKLGFNFNESVELAAEAYYGFFHQKFTVKDPTLTWEKDISFAQFQFPFLFRYNKENGSHIEFGAQYAINSKISETNVSGAKVNAAGYYDKNYWTAVISFGSYMMGWDNLGIAGGMRITYSFNDFISAEGGNAATDIFSYKAANYQPYKNTMPLSVGFVLELNYDLGYLAKSPCNNRREFLFF